MLQELAKFPHEHIAGHIASWTRGQGDFFILYPLARCNLRKFMQETERPELSADVVKWFLRQLQGLADAIRNIHFLGGPSFNTSPGADLFRSERFTAFHHDIKPENILVFQPEEDADVVLTSSTFKISDFGASKFGKLGAEGESSAVSKSHGTATYRGPDIVMSERGASRPFDLWATGCVFLELLSWLFYPFKEAIVDFSSERAKDSGQYQDIADDQFWCRVETPRPSAAASSARPTYLKPQPKGSVAHRPPVLVALRPAVERRLQHLERHHCKNRRAFQDVLKIIRSLLEPDIGKRLNADALLGSLDPVVKQAKADLEVKPDMYTRPHSPSQSPPPKVAMIAVDNKSLGPLDRRRSTQSLNEIQEISKSSASLLDSVSNYGTGPHLSDERHANDHEQEGGLLFGLRDKQVAEPPIVPYSREDITGPLNSPSLMDLSAPEKPEVSDEQDDSRTQDGTSN
jgi:serine/threonine protein kinase